MCGYNLVVECHASDLVARVRFPLPAPVTFLFELFIEQIDMKSISKMVDFFLLQKNHPKSKMKGWCKNEYSQRRITI